MSTYNDIDIACEQCGEEFRGTVWTAVHAGQDPELKDLLLGGELNMVMCPECGHVAYRDHFVLYQEPAAELIAYVYPPADAIQAAELERMMLNGFREAQAVYPEKQRIPYDPILLFGLETLVEMLMKEEERAEQSQIAEALCREQRIPYTLLRPSQARRRGILRVLPSLQEPATTRREAVLGGIDRLLQLNPALQFYQEIRLQIQADAHWAV